MRAALVLIWLLGFASPASADERATVEIIEYGLYTADVTGQIRESSGVVSNVIENLCHLATTTTVPLRQALHFGFRYRVGGPAGELVDLTLAVQFPGAVRPAPTAQPIIRHTRHATLKSGTVSYTGYSFDQAWEFMPGTWSLEVLQGERTLAEKSFTVVDGGALPASPGPSSCFKVSSL